jgi:hypothetical protein
MSFRARSRKPPKKTKFVSHLLFKVWLLALPPLQAIFENLDCQQIILAAVPTASSLIDAMMATAC